MQPEDDVRVVDAPEANRYELYLGDELAGFVDYGTQPGLLTALHAEVDSAYEGRGLGSQLVGGMLDDIRARELRVLPVCPFVRAYVERHPEYADLVGP